MTNPTTPALPALPETSYFLYYQWEEDEDHFGGSEVIGDAAYTADQLRTYGQQCAAEAVAANKVGTPSSNWRTDGEVDPHGDRYDCERAALVMGNLTDDALANGAFMNYDVRPTPQQIIAGTGHSPIAWMTAVKDRIRWLSRALEKAISPNGLTEAGTAECEETHPTNRYLFKYMCKMAGIELGVDKVDVALKKVVHAMRLSPAAPQPAPAVAEERVAFEAKHRQFDLSWINDDWGQPHYVHDNIQCMWEGWQARAALSATPAAPPGFALVPVEPTEAMVVATEACPGVRTINNVLMLHAARTGLTEFPGMGDTWSDSTMAQVYRAMLAAAPKAQGGA